MTNPVVQAMTAGSAREPAQFVGPGSRALILSGLGIAAICVTAIYGALGGPSGLLDPSGFPPRWHCGQWSEGLGWVTIGADLLTFLAYSAIPIALCYFVRKRSDLPFPALLWLFAAFIFACGAVHLVEAIIFWVPVYRLAALVKLVTALVSMVTVFALLPVIPQMLALPGLARVNCILAHEVEERTKAELQVRKRSESLAIANEELEHFAYVASHDLRAPLRAIHNLAFWLGEDLGIGLPPESRDHLALMQQRVQRMDALLDGLLTYSRIGRIAFTADMVDSRELLGGIVEMLGPPPGFTITIEEPMPTLNTSHAALQQVLLNLVTNAIKHHDRATGRIEVAAQDLGEQVRFTVTDDGPGIPREAYTRIFEMFQTLRPRDEVEGTGIGLALVKKEVERFGGIVGVSPAPGRGARFCFTWNKTVVAEVMA